MGASEVPAVLLMLIQNFWQKLLIAPGCPIPRAILLDEERHRSFLKQLVRCASSDLFDCAVFGVAAESGLLGEALALDPLLFGGLGSTLSCALECPLLQFVHFGKVVHGPVLRALDVAFLDGAIILEKAQFLLVLGASETQPELRATDEGWYLLRVVQLALYRLRHKLARWVLLLAEINNDFLLSVLWPASVDAVKLIIVLNDDHLAILRQRDAQLPQELDADLLALRVRRSAMLR